MLAFALHLIKMSRILNFVSKILPVFCFVVVLPTFSLAIALIVCVNT